MYYEDDCDFASLVMMIIGMMMIMKDMYYRDDCYYDGNDVNDDYLILVMECQAHRTPSSQVAGTGQLSINN
jgi:hypothetical protein